MAFTAKNPETGKLWTRDELFNSLCLAQDALQANEDEVLKLHQQNAKQSERLLTVEDYQKQFNLRWQIHQIEFTSFVEDIKIVTKLVKRVELPGFIK